MITAKQLQNEYEKLYSSLRCYIWPYEVVCAIAALEASTYQAFPDLSVVSNNFNKLKIQCSRFVKFDDDLNDKFRSFNEIVDQGDVLYAKLDARKEV